MEGFKASTALAARVLRFAKDAVPKVLDLLARTEGQTDLRPKLLIDKVAEHRPLEV